jgi:inorganic triphosphatase YgiF
MGRRGEGLEIEAKLKVADARMMAALGRLRRIGEFALRPAPCVRVEDSYLDTAGGDLQRAGWACRVRKGKGLQLTVKSIAARAGIVHERREWQETIASADQGAWPKPLRAFLDKLTGGKALVVLCRIRQARRRRMVSEKGRDVLDLSLDTWRILDGSGRRSSPHWTLEAELLPGADPSCLERFLESLGAVAALEPERESKFESALRAAGR